MTVEGIRMTMEIGILGPLVLFIGAACLIIWSINLRTLYKGIIGGVDRG